jgi:UDP-N-acetylglucosamine 2-epimerase (non-hydrolysing)
LASLISVRRGRRRPRILTIFGSRPEATKMAPVLMALAADPELESRVCVTAQHREMLDQVLAFYGIVPDHDLDLMRPRQSLTYLSAAAVTALAPVLEAEEPDLVLVHGDTLTTFVGTYSAFLHQVPVGHVEAGLRSHRLYSPFPEEGTRRLTDAIAALHFAPTPWARDNLLREGLAPDGLFVTGNTAVDAFLALVRQDHAFADQVVADVFSQGRPVVAVEVHRRENWGERMRQILRGLRDALEARPDALALFSVHPNPVVEEAVREVLAGYAQVACVGPQPYVEWANVMARAAVVLSDSGGIQEEAPSAGVRVLLARTETERPEGVDAGTVVLVGVKRADVASALMAELDAGRDATAGRANPYGDGRAAERIVGNVRYALGMSATPPEPWGGALARVGRTAGA